MRNIYRIVVFGVFAIVMFGAVAAHADATMEPGTEPVYTPPKTSFCITSQCLDIVHIRLAPGQAGIPVCAYVSNNAYCDCTYDPDSGNYVASGKCIYW